MDDVFRLFYPLSYLVLFRHPSFSYRIFTCLHEGKDGAHRLPSNEDDENCHEMQQSTNTISLTFPVMFSVTEEDGERQEHDREQLLRHEQEDEVA